MIKESLRKLKVSDTQKKEEIFREVFRYLLGIGSTVELLRTAKKHELKDEVEEIRSTYLSKSTYATSLFWRAFRCWINGAPADVITKRYKVEKSVLQFAERVLTASDISKIQQTLEQRGEVRVSEETVSKLMKEITPLCNKLAGKMRFLYRYDGGLSHEGFRSEFQTEALRVIRHYDYTEDYAYLKNRVIRSVYNYWKRRIDYYTAKRRRRLVKSEGDNEYSLEVFSLDYAQNLDSDDPNYLDLHSIIDSQAESPEQSVIEQDFVEKLTKEISPKISSFVNIIFGREYSNRFISWTEENYSKHPDELSSRMLRKCATKFLCISRKELKDLGMLAVEIGEDNELDNENQERASAG